ncbi:thioesterase family protein [Sulfurovum sp. NBC37-1]|uniref:thioesterase family protein n=1 Tax=Sulfurovum sp. (strain NBC37-1) TaxID=387093 RepID=UPI0005A0FEA5|nr:hotdog domain-containing protein [Sulfurovum sp. NBC37-1]
MMKCKKYNEIFKVQLDDCISDIDSTLPDVLGTYTIVKWMEIVSAKLINQELDNQRYISVGKEVNIEHLAMVKLGEELVFISEILEQNKKEVHFSIRAMFGEKEIARASHVRSIVPLKIVERMMR